MEQQAITLTRDGATATLSFNRPHKRNAISAEMWRRLPQLVAEVESDAETLLLVVRGADDAAFSAGADIGEFPDVYATPESAARYNDDVKAAQFALAALSKPSVAAVQGVCVGGGCGVALCCDLRVAGRGARFGITPAKLGIAYGFEDTKRLVDAVGPSRAKQILFSGDIVDAERALQIGLIDELFEPGQFEQRLQTLCGQIVAGSQYSVRVAKAVIGAIVAGETGPSEALSRQIGGAFSGDDLREGYRAFLQRRRPKFPWR